MLTWRQLFDKYVRHVRYNAFNKSIEKKCFFLNSRFILKQQFETVFLSLSTLLKNTNFDTINALS